MLEASAPPSRLRDRAGDIAWHAERGAEPERARQFALVASEMALANLAFEEALSYLELARRVAPQRAGELDERVAALADRAGWAAIPSAAGDTASRPISLEDLDLRMENPAGTRPAVATRSSS